MSSNLMATNLLTSNRGAELPADVCLRIIDIIIHGAPKNVVILIKLSRSFKKLIKTYERGLTKTAISLYSNAHVNQNIHFIVRNQPASKDFASNLYINHTFAHLLETQTRARIVHEITHDPFSQCHHPTIYWAGGVGFDPPTLAIPLPELEIRRQKFKEEALKLLYELFDKTQGVKNDWHARRRQIDYLSRLSTSELAVLCIFVPILGFNLLEKMKDESIDTKRAVIIFQHNLIRYGPIVAWLQISADTKCKRIGLAGTFRLNEWWKERQAEGVEKLKKFERGRMGEARMILVLWRIFQGRESVEKTWIPRSGERLWEIAKGLVEEKMRGYVV
ncbi:hypothetical protein BGAL_0100g00150 [Botrytis galanthina]|uniref:Uncharacterized protein n=1 Tax=Botrytis galanthina TaxID=278940 RepID=A0A4V4HV37_9HELO|nr:hypothetical protein BGAL_0100g00150 [Botrytis galanthina]